MSRDSNVVDLRQYRFNTRKHGLRIVGDGSELLGTEVYSDEGGGALCTLKELSIDEMTQTLNSAEFVRFIIAIKHPTDSLKRNCQMLLKHLSEKYGNHLLQPIESSDAWLEQVDNNLRDSDSPQSLKTLKTLLAEEGAVLRVAVNEFWERYEPEYADEEVVYSAFNLLIMVVLPAWVIKPVGCFSDGEPPL